MVKKVISYILILCFFGSPLSKLSIYANFKINQDFISKVLCINKEKPKSTCNGKCYLSKKLEEQEKREEKQLPNERSERAEILFCSDNSSKPLSKNVFSQKKNKITIKNSFILSNEFVDSIFQPPQLS